MIKYIHRLIRCGYSYSRAKDLCSEFSSNLSLLDLEYLIQSIEKAYHVD